MRPPPPLHLPGAPDEVVARCAVGFTLYLDDAASWAKEGAVSSLRAFLARASATPLRWCSTSATDDWMAFDPARNEDHLLEALTLPWGRSRPRHGLCVRVVDDPGAPSLAWEYRELDPDRAQGAGHLRVTLDGADADDLLHLVIEHGQSFPLLCGVGGYVASYNPAHTHTAFAAIRRWCKRYAGLDVQHPDTRRHRADEALPGTGWLTLLGPSLAAKVDLSTPWSEGVQVLTLRHAALVRAGDAPSLGDVNALALPGAYGEVAHRLAALLPADSPEFPQWERGETCAWTRRFIEPEAWL